MSLFTAVHVVVLNYFQQAHVYTLTERPYKNSDPVLICLSVTCTSCKDSETVP